ncbi:MAG: hypothetical protein ACM3H8_16570 [Sphingobacteriales bacterium]
MKKTQLLFILIFLSVSIGLLAQTNSGNSSASSSLYFLSFDAVSTGSAVKINWTTSVELDCIPYQVQRSEDGINFYTVDTVPSACNNSSNSYSYIDHQPPPKKVYYRVKKDYENGRSRYTIVKVVLIETQTGVTIFPNPAVNKKITVDMGNLPLGKYLVSVIQLRGKKILSEIKDINQKLFPLDLTGKIIEPGPYFLILSNSSSSTRVKIIFR